MRLVEVSWDDAHGVANGWHDIADIRAEVARHVTTVGYVITDNENGMVLAQGYDPVGEVCDNTIFIPRLNITDVRELARRRRRT